MSLGIVLGAVAVFGGIAAALDRGQSSVESSFGGMEAEAWWRGQGLAEVERILRPGFGAYKQQVEAPGTSMASPHRRQRRGGRHFDGADRAFYVAQGAHAWSDGWMDAGQVAQIARVKYGELKRQALRGYDFDGEFDGAFGYHDPRPDVDDAMADFDGDFDGEVWTGEFGFAGWLEDGSFGYQESPWNPVDSFRALRSM